jgi:hypothetical protein
MFDTISAEREATMTEPERPDLADGDGEEVVPDYSRVGFKALRVLCKDRGIPGTGTVVELIERLKAYDAQHGKDVDLSAAENLPDDEEVDLLDDGDDTPESPVGAEEAASPPAPTGTTPAPPPATPAPARTKADGTVKEGPVKVGEGYGNTDVRAYRREFPHGAREITDADHFGYIAATHEAAHAEGLTTKGGATVGQRVGEGVDADGRRTVIYQVPLKRQQ